MPERVTDSSASLICPVGADPQGTPNLRPATRARTALEMRGCGFTERRKARTEDAVARIHAGFKRGQHGYGLEGRARGILTGEGLVGEWMGRILAETLPVGGA